MENIIKDGITYRITNDYPSVMTPLIISKVTVPEDFQGQLKLASSFKDEQDKEYVVVGIDPDAFAEVKEREITSLVLPQCLDHLARVIRVTTTQYGTLETPTFQYDKLFENLPYLKEIIIGDSDTFATKEGVLYKKDGTGILWVPAAKDDTLTIGVEVKYAKIPVCCKVKKLIYNAETLIDKSLFFHLSSLQEVEINKSNKAFSFIGKLLVKDGTIACWYPREETGDYALPNCITEIGEACFLGCKLSSYSLPSSIQKIGTWAFDRNSNLTHIDLPDSIKQLDPYVFSECTNLVSVKLPKDIKEILSGTFHACYQLNKIEIPYFVEKIGDYAFESTKGICGFKIFKRELPLEVTIHNAKGNIKIGEKVFPEPCKITYLETKEQQEQQWKDELKKATVSGAISEDDKQNLIQLGHHMCKSNQDIEYDIKDAILKVQKAKKRKIALAIVGAVVLGIILLIVL